MIFVGDESVDYPVLHALMELGHEVVAVARDAPGISDLEVLKMAQQHEAILITSDKDFGQLVVSQGHRCRGVVLLRLFELDSASMAAKVAAALEECGDRWEGAFTVVNVQHVRIRPLH